MIPPTRGTPEAPSATPEPAIPFPPPTPPPSGIPTRAHTTRPWVRALWILLGCASCGLGALGIVIPGLPSTVFFIFAAFCFSKSSRRLHDWVLGLPKVGPLVRDYQAGLGMPRSAKFTATALMTLFGGLSLSLIDLAWVRILVLALLITGAVVIWTRVPTRRPE